MWSNRVYWLADELVAPLVDSLMMHLFPTSGVELTSRSRDESPRS